jgi:hypothetical protein
MDMRGAAMTIQVELDPETQARLAAEASSRGMTVEDYAGKILRDHAPTYATGTGILKPGDLKRMTEELTRGAEARPVLPPEANNREFYYEDRP